MKLLTILLFVFLYFSKTGYAQEAITLDDYKRAVSFMRENLVNKSVFNAHIQPNWLPDSSGLWYTHRSPEIKQYMKITIPEMETTELFDHEKLATVLSDSVGEAISAKALSITNISFKNAIGMQFSVKGKSYILNTDTYTLSTAPKKEKSDPYSKICPNNIWTAYSENYNLFIKSKESGESRQLSTKGKKNYEYASWYGWADIIEGEKGERPKHFSVDWSEDSKWIACNICDLRTAQKMYLLDWSIDTLYRPKLLSYFRGSPGDTNMVYMEPVFFNIETGEELSPNLPRATHINATSYQWSETPGKVYLVQSTRGYKNICLYTFDLNTQKMDTLYTETSATNIDNFTSELAEKNKLLFFLSEKSGWRQLYSLNLNSKEEKCLTNGTYFVNEIKHIDEDNQRIYFLASGKEDGRNPYYQHLYSISFEGDEVKLLTPENCHHKCSLSPDGKYFVDNLSTVNQPTRTVLRSLIDGKIITELGNAQIVGIEEWEAPEIFSTIARDNETTIYGAIWKPGNFDSTKTYPILEYSYTGPHTQVFPKDFTRAFSFQSYAELGFIVVVVDGLGSSGRSKKFHDHSYKNLGGNLEDHVNAIRQLGERYQWMDTTRVGIFGHSAGGYDAGRALLAYPDFYKVAVASSADHDHRMEKAWWPEMYMGWPVDSAYHLQSNITMAGNLKGKLLIAHGGIDENVNPSATFKLAEALIKADKQFDMLILPSQRHGYTGAYNKYFTKTRWNYFVKHLRGVEPIWEFDWK